MARRKGKSNSDYARLKRIQELRDTELSKELTMKQLKDYIRKATQSINANLKEYEKYEYLETSVRRIKDIKKQKKGEKVILGVTGKNKDELFAQAQMLKSHFRLDAETLDAQLYNNEKNEKAFETFKERYGKLDKNFTRDDWLKLVELYGASGSDIISQFDSKQLIKIYNQYKQYDNADTTMLQVMIDIVKENKNSGNGLTRRQARSLLNQRLKDILVGE